MDNSTHNSEPALFGEDNILLPHWAEQLINDQSHHFTATSCPFCSKLILVDECKPVFEYYDMGLIHGVDDVTVAIILDRCLTSVEWNLSLQQAVLRTIMIVKKVNGFYLSHHACGKTSISSVPATYQFPMRRTSTSADWYEGDEPSEVDYQDFIQEWEKA